MAGRTDIHWTDDEELLSKFVLRRIPPEDEARLASHLELCKQCQEAVKQERRIAAGAKLAARKELKHRLHSNLTLNVRRTTPSATRMPGYRVPWIRIAGLAAAVSSIIVVGVYNNWFSTDYRHTPSIPENVAQEKQPAKLEPAQKSQEARQRMDEAADESPREKDLAQSVVGAGKEYTQKEMDKTSATGFGERGKMKKQLPGEEPQMSIAAAPQDVADAKTGAFDGRKSETETRLTDQPMIPQPRGFWVEGHIVTGPATSDEDNQKRLARSDANRNALHIRGGRGEEKSLQGRLTSETRTTIANISLTQKSSSSLPLALQYSRELPGIVQTFVENRADSIQLTIFLDSLVSESSLRSENVETISNDSLILHLPNQRIGLRLPHTLAGQVKSKVKR